MNFHTTTIIKQKFMNSSQPLMVLMSLMANLEVLKTRDIHSILGRP